MSQSYDRLTVFPRELFEYDKKNAFLGAGAFGSVYRARKKETGEAVALKVVSTAPRLKARQEDMIKKEVAILQNLAGCQNVVRLLGVCMTPHYAIVMEYIENGDLEKLLLYKRDDHPLVKQWDCRIAMGLDIATGMNFLHTQQPRIIHKDLKSANVLVDQNYCCKISDFGLSQTRGISLRTSTMSSSRHGRGTVAYTAPEKFRGDADPVTADKTDVYSFSIVMWQLKEMKVPFADESNSSMIRANVLAGVRPPISDDECPEGLRNLITRCWHQQPDLRSTFSEIIVVLARILAIIRNGCSPQTRCSTVKRRRIIDNGGGVQEACHGARGMTGDVQLQYKKFASAAAERIRLSSSDPDRAAAVMAFCDLIPEDKWQKLTDLPGKTASETNHCVVTAERKVIVAGCNLLYTSDINSNCPQWISHNLFREDDVCLTTVFTARGCCFATVSRTSLRRHQSIDICNIGDDSRLQVCKLPSCDDRASYSVVGHGDHAYVVGGQDNGGRALDTVLIYDLQTGQQCGSMKLQLGRAACSAVVVGNTLYVAGGRDGSRSFNAVEAMSLSSYSCRYIAPTPTCCCCLSSVSGRLVSTGGIENWPSMPKPTNCAHMLDESSGKWILLPAMNDTRLNHGMCTVADQVVMVVGGCSRSDWRFSETVEAVKLQL